MNPSAVKSENTLQAGRFVEGLQGLRVLGAFIFLWGGRPLFGPLGRAHDENTVTEYRDKRYFRNELVDVSPCYITARPRGLEPPTTGSTVRYSNQLSYGPKVSKEK